MAALPAVPNVLKVFMRGFIDTLAKEIWGNVLHFNYTGGSPGGSALAGLASQIANQWLSHMGPEVPSPTSLNEVQVTDLTSPTAGQGTWTGTMGGGRGDDSIPANACVLITYPTTVRYRGGHPRQYLMAGGNADLQGAAEWSTLFQAEVQTHWQAFLNAVLGLSAGPAVLNGFTAISYYSGKDPTTGKPLRRTTPVLIPLSVSTAVAELEMASQRRRIGRERK